MTSTFPWTPTKSISFCLDKDIKSETNPILQHFDIDHHIEEAFKHDQNLESCGQVKIETKIRFKLLFFNPGCGGTRLAYLDFWMPNWVVVKPEHDGDHDDGEDEDDEEADADVDQQASHHAVGGVDLDKVEIGKNCASNFFKTHIWNISTRHGHKEDEKKGYEDISNLKK